MMADVDTTISPVYGTYCHNGSTETGVSNSPTPHVNVNVRSTRVEVALYRYRQLGQKIVTNLGIPSSYLGTSCSSLCSQYSEVGGYHLPATLYLPQEGKIASLETQLSAAKHRIEELTNLTELQNVKTQLLLLQLNHIYELSLNTTGSAPHPLSKACEHNVLETCDVMTDLVTSVEDADPDSYPNFSSCFTPQVSLNQMKPTSRTSTAPYRTREANVIPK